MILSSLIALYQLIDTYIRLLAFKKSILEELERRLLLESLIWSVASVFLYTFLFKIFGINAATYKFVMMLGWLPYFLIFLRKISGFLKHIFVLGMGAIFSLTQHTIATTIILKLDLKSEYEIILMESAVYLLLFAIFLPIARKYLPYTNKIGHGLGMNSLEIFAKKYNAFVDFSHENGFVQLNLYWNDYLWAK